MKYLNVGFRLNDVDDEQEVGLEIDADDIPDFVDLMSLAFRNSERFSYGTMGIDFSKVSYYYVWEDI